MKVTEFIGRLDEATIIAAIGEAERRTSGEVRVYVSRRAHTDPLAVAQKRFAQLGMTQTRHRNAVLLYLVPRTRQFAVVGDQGVHEKCGDTFWQEVSAELGEGLRTGDPTAAIVRAIDRIGGLLAAHFPPASDNPNELPDAILH
ncbi:MAG: TPM domain-containing protein [Lentisphaeria bacterium]